MGKFEDILIELDALNMTLLSKKRAGGTIAPEEFTLVKELVRNLNSAAAEVEVPEIGRLLGHYDLGLAVRYLEPNYERLNAGFSWLEQQDGADEDEDF